MVGMTVGRKIAVFGESGSKKGELPEARSFQ